MSCAIRAAHASDAQAIVDLIRANYPPRYLDLSVVGCTGAPHYVRDRIEIGARDASTFLVAVDDDGILGTAELRRRPSGMFVNHVVVAGGHQGRRVGSSLLRFGAASLHLTLGDTVALDVFADNAAAIAWYRRLGMETVAQNRIFRLDPKRSVTGMWQVDDLLQCRMLLETYGFGNCRVVTRVADYVVGVLDTGVVKTSGIAGDEVGIGALTHLWPQSILLSEEGSLPGPHGEHATTLRMAGSVAGMLEALGDR